MKSLNSLIYAATVFFFVATSLTSCSHTTKSLNAIPENAKVISIVDTYELIKKGKLDEISELNFFKTIKEEIKNESKADVELFNNVIEDPSITGIDLKSEMIQYFFDYSSNYSYSVALTKLSSSSKFEDFLEKITQNQGKELDIITEDGYKYISVDADVISAWDNEMMITISSQNLKGNENLSEVLEYLMQLGADETITNNDHFNAFYKDKADWSVWVNGDALLDSYSFMKIMLMQKLDTDLSDNYLSFHLSFEDDYISLLSEFDPNEKLEKRMNESKIWDNSFNDELLELLPKTSLMAASFSINPEGFYEELKKQKSFKETRSKLKKETRVDMQELIQSFKGSALLNMYDFKYLTKKDYDHNSTHKGVPILGLVFDLNNDDIIQDLINEIPAGEIIVHDNYYEIENTPPFYFSHNQDFLFISNDLTQIEKFVSNEVNAENLDDAKMSSELKTSSFYGFINTDLSEYPKEFRQEFIADKSGQDKVILEILDEIAESLEIKQKEKNVIEIRLNVKEDGDNSLHTFIKTIDENYERLISL